MASRRLRAMFTYVMLGSNDLSRAGRFYDAVLGALGHTRCSAGDDAEGLIGWGRYADDGRQELALWVGAPFDGRTATTGNGTMVALRAASRAQVDAFHAAALRHGGRSEGAPGLRPHYGPDFYVAYVRDPDGNKLAAVCRAAED